MSILTSFGESSMVRTSMCLTSVLIGLWLAGCAGPSGTSGSAAATNIMIACIQKGSGRPVNKTERWSGRARQVILVLSCQTCRRPVSAKAGPQERCSLIKPRTYKTFLFEIRRWRAICKVALSSSKSTSVVSAYCLLNENGPYSVSGTFPRSQTRAP